MLHSYMLHACVAEQEPEAPDPLDQTVEAGQQEEDLPGATLGRVCNRPQHKSAFTSRVVIFAEP